MIAVLDASAAVGIVFARDDAAAARDAVQQADGILAPGLFISEVTNTIWKYVQFQGLEQNEAERALDYCLGLPDDFADDRDLHREAFSLSCGSSRSAYDMFYIALARRNDAMILTLDQKVKQLAESLSIRTL